MKKDNPSISLGYVFFTFLKIGVTSFGGYASLVAMVQHLMVERDKTIEDDTIVKGFALASMLPGPVAVNTVTYIGYKLRSWSGGLLAMGAVVLPSMLLMIVLSVIYKHFAGINEFKLFVKGVLPVVLAIIASMVIKLGRDTISSLGQVFLVLLVLGLQYMLKGYWGFLLSFMIGGLYGYVFMNDKAVHPQVTNKTTWLSKYQLVAILTLLFFISLNFLPLAGQWLPVKLFTVFAGVSLTLFGGGYVMIPILNSIVVMQHGWLTSSEFADAIILGQITPGPILISATFVGYRVAGWAGALLATIGIFLPSGILMMLVSGVFEQLEKQSVWQAILKGIRPVVLALIIYSLLVLGSAIDNWQIAMPVAFLSLLLLYRFKINFLWLILPAGLLNIFT